MPRCTRIVKQKTKKAGRTGRYVAKPQNSKKRVVVQSICDGDKQTMPDM